MRKCFCDRCGKECEPRDIKEIKISVGNPSYYGVRDYDCVSVEICKECQENTGVLDFLKKTKRDEAPLEKTTQDKFFELFRDLVSSSIQDML